MDSVPLRFYRHFKIAPGLRINLSRSGVSTSVGRRGACFTIGPRGTRETIGIPGTRLSYSEHRRIDAPGAQLNRSGSESRLRRVLWLSAILGITLASVVSAASAASPAAPKAFVPPLHFQCVRCVNEGEDPPDGFVRLVFVDPATILRLRLAGEISIL